MMRDELAHIFKPYEEFALCGRRVKVCGDIIEIADYETDTAGGVCAECDLAHSEIVDMDTQTHIIKTGAANALCGRARMQCGVSN